MEKSQDYVFKINEMDCAEEVNLLKKGLSNLVGGEEYLAFDLLHRKLTIRTPLAIEMTAILAAIKTLGLTAEVWGQSAPKRSPFQKYGKLALVWFSAMMTLLGFLLVHSQFPLFSKLAYTLAILSGGWFVFPRAYASFKMLRPDMNLLMSIAVVGAIGIGDWLEAATVTFLFSFSLLLESWSVERARKAIEALLQLTPDFVRIITEDQSETMVPATTVAIGTIFLIKPGEKISLDGIVLNGFTEVNQAPITGESLPITKQEGDPIFAGSINGSGVVEIKSTASFDQSTLSKMIRLIQESHLKRAQSEQWVEKFSRLYTPFVILLAFLVLVMPPLFLGGAWSVWLYRSLVLLVIACPCALVISTPVSIVAGLASAARQGVLIKGGKFLEIPALLKAIAFDKTGTLTQGALSVDHVETLADFSEIEILTIAKALASKNEHPASKAITIYTNSWELELRVIENYQSLPGKGATATIQGQEYWMGSHRYLEERGQEEPHMHLKIEALNQRGSSIVVIGTNKHVMGFIALSDTPRKDASSVVQALQNLGIHPIMLTGDNQGSAKKISEVVGIQEVHSELLPDQKVRLVETLVQKFGMVAMIGDGINDAPAMARSSLAIAMGVAGSDTAIETADIALMSDDLTKIPWLIAHSKRTQSIIQQNITLSIGIKVLFVLLVFYGHASLWSAILADMGTSLVVIFNGLRLLK